MGSDYTGFVIYKTAAAALLLALATPSHAENRALNDARGMAGGATTLGAFDGGCSGGSCGVEEQAVCTDETCRINRAAGGAQKTGGLPVAEVKPRAAMTAEVPAPKLNADKKDAKDKPGFFSNLFSGKGLMYGLGGAAAGAGIGFLLGGPIGAIIGGLLGAVGGFFLSKMLAK